MVGYEYKCRRCSAVFTGGVCPAVDPHEVVDAQLNNIPPFQYIAGSVAFESHKCDDGGAGLADWIGCNSR